MRKTLLAAALLVVAGCAKDAGTAAGDTAPRVSVPVSAEVAPGTERLPDAAATMRDDGGEEAGRVTFTVEDDGISVDARLTGLPPGFHGFHVHDIGRCEPPFTSAGGHLSAPGDEGHPGHAGDQPVVLVLENGSAALRFTTDRYTIPDLLEGDGTAVIVHAAPDNFGNVPPRYLPEVDMTTTATGDTGVRIACGVVEQGTGANPVS